MAHFADYLRVCLLYKYGGLWLDATIFCADRIPEDYFEVPFFTCKSEYQESKFISHYQWVTFVLGGWKGNVFYAFMKEAFEIYWENNTSAIDYLFFDELIYIARENVTAIKQMICKKYPEIFFLIPRIANSITKFILLRHIYSF